MAVSLAYHVVCLAVSSGRYMVHRCPVCGRRFASSVGFEHHLAYGLCGGRMIFICPRCGARFTSPKFALRHARFSCHVRHMLACGPWGTYPITLAELEEDRHDIVDRALPQAFYPPW